MLTSTNADPAFLAALEDKLASLPLPPAPTHASSTTSNAETETGGNVRIEYRPARDFYSTAGKHALSRVKVLERSAVLPATEEERQPGEMLDDRGMRYCELRLEAQLNNLIANPLTVRNYLRCSGLYAPSPTLLSRTAAARMRGSFARAYRERSDEGWRPRRAPRRAERDRTAQAVRGLLSSRIRLLRTDPSVRQ